MHEKDCYEFDEIYPNEVTFIPRRLTLHGSIVSRLPDLSITSVLMKIISCIKWIPTRNIFCSLRLVFSIQCALDLVEIYKDLAFICFTYGTCATRPLFPHIIRFSMEIKQNI